MRFVLDLVYAIALLVVSPWLAVSLQRDRAWGELPARFGRGFDGEPGALWLHGSSVGEISLLAPLIAKLEQAYPDTRLIITSFTRTGLAAARARYGRHIVLPFPLDFSFVVGPLLARLAPCAIVIVESDIWPNFVRAAIRQSIPVVVVNAKMSARSCRRHQWARVLPPLARQLHAVGAQTREHASRFVALGVPEHRVTVTGNMKYDLTVDAADAGLRRRARERLGIDPAATVVIGASLHLPEDEAVLDGFAALASRYSSARLIIVPRYPADGAEMAGHARARGLEPVLKSVATPDAQGHIAFDSVLIADTLGELRELYHAADIAYVGGSLYFRGPNKGGHNLMEPAILGLPVLFGPHNFSFKETVADLLAADAGILVEDAAALAAGLERLLASPETRSALGQRARDVVLAGQGATARSLELIAPLLPGSPVAGRVATDDNAPVRT